MEEKLIEAVRVNKILFDISHPDYMRSKLESEKWEEIAKEIGMKNGVEAKATWEKLRHSLRDALRRQQKCIKSGVAAETIKQWKFQKQMSFLQPYMGHDVNHDRNEIEVELEPECPPALKKTKTVKRDNVITLLKQNMEKREERHRARANERALLLAGQQRSEVVKNDSLYHFFISMYESTKKMPLTSQYSIKNYVFKTVSDMEAKLLNIPLENEHASSTPAHYSSYSNSSCSNTMTIRIEENDLLLQNDQGTTTLTPLVSPSGPSGHYLIYSNNLIQVNNQETASSYEQATTKDTEINENSPDTVESQFQLVKFINNFSG